MCRESPSQLGDSGASAATSRGGPMGTPLLSTLTVHSFPSVTNAISEPSGDQTGPVSCRLPTLCCGKRIEYDQECVMFDHSISWFSPSRYRLEYGASALIAIA